MCCIVVGDLAASGRAQKASVSHNISVRNLAPSLVRDATSRSRGRRLGDEAGAVAKLEQAFGKYFSERSTPPEWPRPASTFYDPRHSRGAFGASVYLGPHSEQLNKLRVSLVEDAECTQTSVARARRVYFLS